MSSTDEARFHFKVFAVNMALSGCPVSQISTMAGVSKVTVTGWVKTADERGFDALRSRQRSGRPPKLSTEQCAVIDSAIQSDPNLCQAVPASVSWPWLFPYPPTAIPKEGI